MDAYDELHRLEDAEEDLHPRAEYEYNPLNWRTVERTDTDTASTPHALDEMRVHLYDASWRLLESRIDSDFDPEETSPEFEEHTQLVWGLRYIDDIVSTRRDLNPAEEDGAEVRMFHATDAQFSSVAVLLDNGSLLERVAYSPYGVARHQWPADASGDGSVNSADRSIVLSSYGAITAGNYRSEADFNRDGVVNAADLAAVLSYAAALPEGTLSSPAVANRTGYCGYRFAPKTEMYLARNRLLSPPLGRWIERDPLEYVDGMGLYEYTAGIAIAVADPTGLATIGACSGINMRGRNYVADWLDDNDYTIDERFLLASTCHAGNGSICQGYVVHPLSRVTLDEEAERLGSTARMPSLCRADGQRAKLEIVMVSPKTNETPMDAGLKGSAGDGWTADCCDIRFTIVDDPKDDVPNQSVFDDFARGRQPLWDRYGNAIRVDNVRCCDCCSSYQDGLFARHDFFNFLGCPRVVRCTVS